MPYLAVDLDGSEWIYAKEPEKKEKYYVPVSDECIRLPDNTIKRIIGRTLTFKDKPVKIKVI